MIDMDSEIRIKSATKAGYDEYFAIRCDESDIYWMGHAGKPNYDMLKSIYMNRLWDSPLEQNGARRIYFIMLGLDIIGFVMLSNIEGSIELGISVKTQYQQRGFGSKAISLATKEALKYSKKICANIRDDNLASQHSFMKNGFCPSEEYEMKDYPQAGNVKFRKYIYKDCI